MKQCLRTLVLLIWKTVSTVKRRACAPLFDLHSHVHVQIWTHEPMSVCSFEHNFSFLRLMRRVSTSFINCEAWQCAIFSLKTLFCTILTYVDVSRCKFSHEDVYVWNFSHTKSCQRSLVWPTRRTVMCIHCEKRTSTQLFDLHGRVRMQIFSSEDVSVYNVSHNVLCLGLDRLVSTQCVDYKACSCACSHTKRPVSAKRRLRRGSLTCWLMKTCLCVTFNISYRVFHLWPIWNDVHPNDLTWKPSQRANFYIRNYAWEHWFDYCEDCETCSL